MHKKYEGRPKGRSSLFGGENLSETMRRSGESYEDYRVRLCENMNTYGLTWPNVADLLNGENGHTYTECKYRKEWKAFVRGRQYERSKGGNDYLLAQARELEKQRVGLAEQRAALKRILKDDAQKSLILDEIRDSFKQCAPIEFGTPKAIRWTENGTLVVCVSDTHFGIEFDSKYGTYNTDIGKARLEEYAARVLAEATRFGASKCVVALLGDLVSGLAHSQIRVENRENYIDQIKVASEVLSQFVASIAGSFESVDVYGAPGNHSRAMQDERDAFVSEAFDNLIPWYMMARLSSYSNVIVHQEMDPAGITEFNVNGETMILAHGHLDSFDDKGVSITKLSNKIGKKIRYVFCGHLHEPEEKTILGATIVRSGCLCGCGDEYTNKHRFSGNAEQTMVAFDAKGREQAIVRVFFE